MFFTSITLHFSQEFRENRARESETSVYSLWRVEEFAFLQRSKSEAGLKINGIRKIHQLSLTSEGIRARKLSCMDCGSTSLCLNCKQQKLIFTADKIKLVLDSSKENDIDEESDEEIPLEGPENMEDDDSGDEEKTRRRRSKTLVQWTLSGWSSTDGGLLGR